MIEGNLGGIFFRDWKMVDTFISEKSEIFVVKNVIYQVSLSCVKTFIRNICRIKMSYT